MTNQNPAVDDIYPYVIRIREIANGNGGWNRTYELLHPSGSFTSHATRDEAWDAASAAIIAKRQQGTVMQDINLINRQNAEAIERDIPRQLAAGKIVVAEYVGQDFVGYETFSGEYAEAEANAKVAEISSHQGGIRFSKIFYPQVAQS